MVVKLCLPEEDSELAGDIFRLGPAGEVEFVAPSLLYYELANALRFSRHVRPEEVPRLLASIRALGMEEVPPSEDDLASAIAEAKSVGSSVYDAIYLVLAKTRKGIMVTSDLDFEKKARSRHVSTLVKAHAELVP